MLHLVGLTLIYLSKMHGHSNIKLIINLKSRGIERVVIGVKYIQHFSLQTNLCVLDDGLESYGHLVGVKLIMILDFIDRQGNLLNS